MKNFNNLKKTNYLKLFKWLAYSANTFIFLAFTIAHVHARQLPEGFSQEKLADSLKTPTTMTFSPDGRLFLAEKNGAIRVVKNDKMLLKPAIKLVTDSLGPHTGIGGIVFDPDFFWNHYVYIYYTVPVDPLINRISRFVVRGDEIVAKTEKVLLDMEFPVPAHIGGAMVFGKDGKLYAALGYNNNEDAQNLDNYHGKVIRINKHDGSPAYGNPFKGSGAASRIWCYGLRNPYSMSVHPKTGRILINDVGEKDFEEINDATEKGKNFGWPLVEGFTDKKELANPSYVYPWSQVPTDTSGCAITGGDFYTPSYTNFPAEYKNKYFIMDFCSGWIKAVDFSGKKITATTFGSITPYNYYLRISPDGNIYYINLGFDFSARLYKIEYTNPKAPQIVQQPVDTTVDLFKTATFKVEVNSTKPVSYQWQFNDLNIPGANFSALKIPYATPLHEGEYRVIIKNINGSTISDAATLEVTQCKELPHGGRLSLSPNPFIDGNNLKINGSAESIVSVKITNINGKVVYQDDKHSVDNVIYFKNALIKGIYIVQVRANNKVYQLSLIKE